MVVVGPKISLVRFPEKKLRFLARQMSDLILVAGLLGAVLHAQSPTSAEVGLRIIVVGTQAEAETIIDRLKYGEDFAALAKQKSTDATADEGGYMGKLDPATLRVELRDALRVLKPGEISGVVKLPSGFAILKVLPPGEGTQPGSANPSRLLPLTAPGSVRYPPVVGGKGEADLAFRSMPKPAGWQQDLRQLCSIRQQSLAMVVGELQKNLDPATPQAKTAPLDLIQTHYALANIFAYEGKTDQAIEQWQAAYQVASEQLPKAMPELEEVLGIIYLHKSEQDNDVYRSPGERCIFPMKPDMKYAKPESSEKAVEYFQKYLARKPDALDVRWLLNLAYMTLGQYPTGVPRDYLIPPSTFESPEDMGRFVDVAPETGLNHFAMSGGLIVDDFENNGRYDIVTSGYGQCEQMQYFHNNGDGTFSDQTAKAGLAGQTGGLNMIQGDYNNDGCTDILVLRGAWEFPQRKSLLRNNCDGTFTDVTAASGLAEPATSTQTAVWVDIDNDGLLDLFVGNENSPAQLFHNEGNGTFKDIAHSAGVDRTGFTKAVVAADYDNDGYPDLFVSNLNGDKFLYHNNHNLTFTEVAKQAGVTKPWQSFPAWFFDYDNDGWPDLFIASYYVSVDESVRSYLGVPGNVETLKLYRNLGNGTFRDVTAEVGLDRVFMPMGSNFGDIDNDGFLDIYLGTGNPTFASVLPNVMLHNKEGKFFTDVTAATGTGELHKGHAVAFADIDNDGDEDLITEIGGAEPGDSHAFRLFENPGNGNDWISLHLVGVKSNRSAIGARIKVTVENEGHAARDLYRTVGSGGSFGASPLAQHFGLGKSVRSLNLEIWWPTSGTRQVFSNVEKNQWLEIKEFAKDYTRLERHSLRLGGANRKVTAASPAAVEKAAPSK